jgi:hypothetical protein
MEYETTIILVTPILDDPFSFTFSHRKPSARSSCFHLQSHIFTMKNNSIGIAIVRLPSPLKDNHAVAIVRHSQ